MTKIFSVENELNHIKFCFFGIKLRIPHPIDKQFIREFSQHKVAEKTILLVEMNNCHKETLPGYYKYLKDLGYNVEILMNGSSENVFCRVNDNVKIWELRERDLEKLVQKDYFKKYERLIFNSKILYKREDIDLQEYLPRLKSGRKENIYVQHHIDKWDDEENCIILANPAKEIFLENLVVNPHYFGEVKYPPKNDKTNFITIGELDAKRRNCGLLIDVVNKLVATGENNFKITVIGRGSLDGIPENIKPYFDIKGRLDFSSMYDELEKSDYFLPLLDPENPTHDRYIKFGTSGSFQLIYGFLKPCIINKKFADVYGFDNRNSLVYGENADLYKAMQRAIMINNTDYKKIIKRLEDGVKSKYSMSMCNIKRLLGNINKPARYGSELKFSIVIPIYNTEKYLVECIQSVLEQTYSNIEIILINDGSTDSSERICKDFEQIDSRIKYFYKNNEGVAIARNFGISQATGNYIYCMDSDDTIEAVFFEKINKSLLRDNADLVVVGEYFCDKPIKFMGALPTCAFTVKREFLQQYPNVRFQEYIQPCEDGLFSHKLLALTRNVVKCSDAKYFYRHREGSSEHSITFQKIYKEMPIWFNVLEEFYTQYNLWDTHLIHLLSFIENEPFSLRFKCKRFKLYEKRQLFYLIHKFVEKHNLSINGIQDFQNDFNAFINSKKFIVYIFKILRKTFFQKNTKFNIAYCSQCRNVGDNFNTVLLDKLKIKYKQVEYGMCNLCMIGSNLDNIIIQNDAAVTKINNTTINVLGTGFIEKEKGKEKAIKPINILAVRGKLSLERVINLDNVYIKSPVTGDLGLLASKLFPVNKNVKYDLGVIPHYLDKNNENLLNVKLKKYNLKFIDVQQDCAKFFEEINQCRCIISSSLHGLIFSDSYNIPNVQIVVSDKIYGGNYKFRDYYSIYNQEYIAPLDLRNVTITDNIVDNIIKHYVSKKDIIEAKQYEFMNILDNLY